MGKHNKIIRLIFQNPTSSQVNYKDAKALLESLGAEYSKGNGSRRKFFFPNIGDSGRVIILHEPHGKELCKDTVDDIRDVLLELNTIHDILVKSGVSPDPQ